MDRRSALIGLAAAVAAALTGCTDEGNNRPWHATPALHGTIPAPSGFEAGTTAGGVRFAAPKGLSKAPLPRGTLTRLPGDGHSIALTIDDGTDTAVLGAYADLCRATGLRATFFCNGVNRSWTEHAPILRPLVEEDQIFMANHTWSHPDLLRLSSAQVADQVRRNEAFLMNTYGVTGRPFLRPPFGYRNARLDAQLADLGYPAVTMWLGSLGDATLETPQKIVSMADRWFLPQHLVIGHANHPPVIKVMDQLIQVIQERHLQPVHLGDVFATPPQPSFGTSNPAASSG